MKKALSVILSVILIMTFAITSLGLTSIAVKSIKLDTGNITLQVGKTYTLKTTFTPANTTNKQLTYSSENENIATVDKNGKIKGIKAGKTVITVTSSTNKKAVAKCNVTINTHLQVIIAGIPDTNVTVGIPKDIALSVNPSDSSITAVSSDESKVVVSVSDNIINIMGISPGTAAITVIASKAGYTDAMIMFNVTAVKDIAMVAIGHGHTVVLKEDGTVWAWGDNEYGQLGDGTTVDKCTPVQVKGIIGVKMVATGFNCTVALKEDGTVWAWGENVGGELGDGTTFNKSIPVQVKGISSVKMISANNDSIVALRDDGTIWGWGWNFSGQLGDNKEGGLLTIPVQVNGISRVKMLAASSINIIALKEDGTIWAWGNNNMGQLGDGTTVNKSTPVQVKGLNNMKMVAAGEYYSIALKEDGTVWTWGINDRGQLGNGTSEDYSTIPVQVQGINNVKTVAVGDVGDDYYAYTVALKDDGTVWTWGDNE